MSACSFGQLVQFVNKQLDLDEQLQVYNHLDLCDICRDAVFELARDLGETCFVHCAHHADPSVLRYHADVGFPGAYR